MDFLDLVHKKNSKSNKTAIIASLILVVIIAVLLLAIRFWPKDEQRHVLTYLPEEVSYYFHFADSDSWENNPLMNYPLLDTEVLDGQINRLNDLIGVSFLNTKEIIWFRVEGNDADHYLLRIKPLQKQVLDQAREENPNLYFGKLAKDILLITPAKDLAESAEEQDANDDFLPFYDRGMGLYWHLDSNLAFLEKLRPVLSGLFSSDEVKVHIEGDLSINLYDVDGSLDQSSFPDYQIPQSFDLAMAFSQYTPDYLAGDIENYLIKGLAGSLPYKNIGSEIISEQILHDMVVFQRGDDWLLVFFEEPEPVLLNFLDSYELSEVSKRLPDGTLYKELVVSPEQSRKEVAYSDSIYYQIANLYLHSSDEVNYLSSSEEMLREIVGSGRPASAAWSDCLGQAKVGDFVYIDVENIDNSPVKDYLAKYNIHSLSIFSYSSESTEGLQICL